MAFTSSSATPVLYFLAIRPKVLAFMAFVARLFEATGPGSVLGPHHSMKARLTF